MEGRFVVTALIFTIIAACSKQDIHETSLVKMSLAQEQEPQSGVYSSGWESIPAWNATTSPEAVRFSYTRQMPNLNKDVLEHGVVIIFARNLWAEEAGLKEMDKAPEKPLMMPFYFLPYFEKPDYTEQWNYTAEENKVTISLVVKGGEDAAVPGKKIQLRYIVIPAQTLKEKKQTAAAVRKLSYDKLVQTFGLSS